LCALAAVLLVAGGAAASAAQEMRSVTPTRQLEFWGGVAHNSPEWGVLGDTPGMSLAMFGVRFARPVGRAPAFVGDTRATFLHLDLLPIVLMSRPYLSAWDREAAGCEKSYPCYADPRDDVRLFSPDAAMGIGANPIGITTFFRRNGRLSPSVGATGGFLYFSRPVPTSSSASFNFTAALEVGLRIGRSEEAGVSLVYRLHHISNAGTARENPAVASHLLTVVARTPRRPIARR
jgi:hypothetical protein